MPGATADPGIAWLWERSWCEMCVQGLLLKEWLRVSLEWCEEGNNNSII